MWISIFMRSVHWCYLHRVERKSSLFELLEQQFFDWTRFQYEFSPNRSIIQYLLINHSPREHFSRHTFVRIGCSSFFVKIFGILLLSSSQYCTFFFFKSDWAHHSYTRNFQHNDLTECSYFASLWTTHRTSNNYSRHFSTLGIRNSLIHTPQPGFNTYTLL